MSSLPLGGLARARAYFVHAAAKRAAAIRFRYLLDSLPELRESRLLSELRMLLSELCISELDEPDDLLDVLVRSLDPVLFFMLEESELLFLCPMSRSCVAIVS